jgi:hypothetical protein
MYSNPTEKTFLLLCSNMHLSVRLIEHCWLYKFFQQQLPVKETANAETD